MKLSTLLVITSFSISSFASDIDYSLCTDFINKTDQNSYKTANAMPFTISEKGDVVVKPGTPGSFETEGNATVLRMADASATLKMSISKNANKVLDKLEIETIFYPAGKPMVKQVNTVMFEVKNGKCYAKKAERISSVNGVPYTSTVFDTDLCKDLEDHIASNKAVAQCFDPSSKENKGIADLFDKNGYKIVDLLNRYANVTNIFDRTAFSVEQKVIAGNAASFSARGKISLDDSRSFMAMAGGSPMVSAYMLMSDCKERGLKLTLDDKKLWEKPEASAETSSSSAAPAVKK